nr:protein-tyrosine sulfotransferase 2 isoform X3 [Microcebus murinus]
MGSIFVSPCLIYLSFFHPSSSLPAPHLCLSRLCLYSGSLHFSSCLCLCLPVSVFFRLHLHHSPFPSCPPMLGHSCARKHTHTHTHTHTRTSAAPPPCHWKLCIPLPLAPECHPASGPPGPLQPPGGVGEERRTRPRWGMGARQDQALGEGHPALRGRGSVSAHALSTPPGLPPLPSPQGQGCRGGRSSLRWQQEGRVGSKRAERCFWFGALGECWLPCLWVPPEPERGTPRTQDPTNAAPHVTGLCRQAALLSRRRGRSSEMRLSRGGKCIQTRGPPQSPVASRSRFKAQPAPRPSGVPSRRC